MDERLSLEMKHKVHARIRQSCGMRWQELTASAKQLGLEAPTVQLPASDPSKSGEQCLRKAAKPNRGTDARSLCMAENTTKLASRPAFAVCRLEATSQGFP